MELDALDRLAAEVFDGFIVRKDLVMRFKGQYPVPTYVAEFLLGRYCGQVWSISPGTLDEHPGLYRVEVNVGPGSGVKILNRPQPPAFVESTRYGEQNLYSRSRELVGDRDPRSHEFSVQLRAFDSSRSGAGLSLAVLLGLCGALLQKSIKGGLVVTGALNLGGSVDPIHNAVEIAELAIDKGAAALLMPVSSRKQLFNLPDDLATKIDIQFYLDGKEALVKSLAD